MKYVIEGLILLANTALFRIREELQVVWVKNRILGPIEDILVALRGLQEVVKEDRRLYDYVTVFIATISKRREILMSNVVYSEIEHLVSDWGSIFQSLEKDCLSRFP